MYDFVREFRDGSEKEFGVSSVIVGRIINGRRVSLYHVHLDFSCDGRDWCRDHGMKLVCRVPNIEKTKWYEIWQSDDRGLMCAFLI